MPLQRRTDPQEDSALAIVLPIPGRFNPMEARFGRWALAFTVRFQSCRFPETPDSSFGPHRITDQSFGLDRRTSRGLKDGNWLGWGPMYHWTDHKIRIHAFYCMLGISLLKYIHKQAQAAWPGLSMEQLLDELRQIQQFVLLYPPQGDKGPQRAAIVRSKQTFPQLQLAKTLGLDELGKPKSR